MVYVYGIKLRKGRGEELFTTQVAAALCIRMVGRLRNMKGESTKRRVYLKVPAHRVLLY